MSCRISADIGGTCTDMVLLDDETGLYRTAKVLTTPELLTTGIMQGMDYLSESRVEMHYVLPQAGIGRIELG